MSYLLELCGLSMVKQFLHLAMKCALIAFEREHVVGLLRHDLLQAKSQSDTKGSDEPLNVAPANAEYAEREEHTYECNRVPRDYLDRIGGIRLHLESLQQDDVEQRADVAHDDDGDCTDDNGKKEVTDGQRARYLLAIRNIHVIP